jgi:plastocyanin
LKVLLSILMVSLMAGASVAETSQIAPNVYRVSGGVEFTLGNAGASNYLFTWSDASGTYSGIIDPTLILSSGQTYQFRRISIAHPFAITDDTLPVSGSDGNYVRGTTSASVISAATLDPIADFTADPAPTSDFIEWTPTAPDAGTYYYVCTVTSHTGMTGKIMVEAGSVSNERSSFGSIKALFGN